MTAINDLDRDLGPWLASEGALPVPTDLHPIAMERVRNRRQRPAWLAMIRDGSYGWPVPGSRRSVRRVALLLVALALILAAALIVMIAGRLRPEPIIPVGRNGGVAITLQDDTRGSGGGTFVAAQDGSDIERIDTASCPTYSLDGRVIAWIAGDDAMHSHFEVGPSVGATHEVLLPGGADYSFDSFQGSYALSPDGSKIAWLRPMHGVASDDGTTEVESQNEIWVVAVDGGPASVLVPASADPNVSYGIPAWSPDGRRLAFETFKAFPAASDVTVVRTGVETVNADATGLQRLSTRPAPRGSGLSWSPDGRSIAYVGVPDGESDGAPTDIFVIDADGTHDRNVTTSTTSERKPEWSPDGERLAYISSTTDAERNVLTTVAMDDGVTSGPPVQGPAADWREWVVWSPDATSLLTARQTVTPATDRGSRATETILARVDRDFREAPVAMAVLKDRSILCEPSWERLDP